MRSVCRLQTHHAVHERRTLTDEHARLPKNNTEAAFSKEERMAIPLVWL